MTISYEPAPVSMAPVMLLDARRGVRFTTMAARALCERWHHGLKDHDAGFRIPEDIESMLRVAADRGWDVSNAGICVRHPELPELSVTIQLGNALSGLYVQGWYLLTFSAEAAARSQAENTLSQLSPGERRVALLVAEGLRNEEVAQRLQRSRRTVEYQLNVIFRKLDLTCRSQLVRALAPGQSARPKLATS